MHPLGHKDNGNQEHSAIIDLRSDKKVLLGGDYTGDIWQFDPEGECVVQGSALTTHLAVS